MVLKFILRTILRVIYSLKGVSSKLLLFDPRIWLQILSIEYFKVWRENMTFKEILHNNNFRSVQYSEKLLIICCFQKNYQFELLEKFECPPKLGNIGRLQFWELSYEAENILSRFAVQDTNQWTSNCQAQPQLNSTSTQTKAEVSLNFIFSSHPVPSHPVPSHRVPSHPVPSHPPSQPPTSHPKK